MWIAIISFMCHRFPFTIVWVWLNIEPEGLGTIPEYFLKAYWSWKSISKVRVWTLKRILQLFNSLFANRAVPNWQSHDLSRSMSLVRKSIYGPQVPWLAIYGQSPSGRDFSYLAWFQMNLIWPSQAISRDFVWSHVTFPAGNACTDIEFCMSKWGALCNAMKEPPSQAPKAFEGDLDKEVRAQILQAYHKDALLFELAANISL